MYYGSGTVDRIASGQLARNSSGRCMCTHQISALFWAKWQCGRHL